METHQKHEILQKNDLTPRKSNLLKQIALIRKTCLSRAMHIACRAARAKRVESAASLRKAGYLEGPGTRNRHIRMPSERGGGRRLFQSFKTVFGQIRAKNSNVKAIRAIHLQTASFG